MKGLLMDMEHGDLLVGHGSLVIGETDNQIAEIVLLSFMGEVKEDIRTGGELKKMQGGTIDVMWPVEVKRMLLRQGLDVKKVSVKDNGTIIIE